MNSPATAEPLNWSSIAYRKWHRYRAALLKYWTLLFGFSLLGICTGVWQQSRMKMQFVSTGRMIVSGRILSLESSAYSEETANYFGTQLQLMQGPEVRARAEARIRATTPERGQTSPVNLEAALLPNSSIFVLRTSGESPDDVQRMLNATMQEYVALKNEMRNANSEKAHSALSEQLSRLEREVQEGQEELIDFQKENNIGFLQEQGNSAAQFLSEKKRELAELRTESQLLESVAGSRVDSPTEAAQVTRLESREPSAAAAIPGNASPELEYFRLTRELEDLKSQRDDYGKDLRPRHPIMTRFSREIERVSQLLASYREQTSSNLVRHREILQLKIRNLDRVIAEWEQKAAEFSYRLAQYEGLKNRNDRKKSTLDRLLGSVNTMEVSRNIDQTVVSILDPASAPEALKPGTLKAIFSGLFAGFGIGLALVLLADQLDDRCASFPEFRDRLHERVLAQIPELKGNRPPVRLGDYDDRHGFGEAFRSLRSSLFFMRYQGPAPKAFLICSAMPDEGKSTIATNLAITLARANRKVLLVDGDLRRGMLNAEFGAPLSPGLTDVLRESIPLASAVWKTEIPGLSVLSRGTMEPNPGELYLSRATDEFLREAYRDWDYIVIDSSPVMAADDATSLAPKVDATLFVFRIAVSSTQVSQQGIDLLRERNANVLGTVCNSVEVPEEYYYYPRKSYTPLKRIEEEAVAHA